MVDLEIRKLLKIWRMEIPDKAHQDLGNYLVVYSESYNFYKQVQNRTLKIDY